MKSNVAVDFSTVEGESAALRGYRAAKEAYAIMLRIPHTGTLRVDAQGALCGLRDFIAEVEGRTSQEVQEEYEART
jgi:hypothetical protein